MDYTRPLGAKNPPGIVISNASGQCHRITKKKKKREREDKDGISYFSQSESQYRNVGCFSADGLGRTRAPPPGLLWEEKREPSLAAETGTNMGRAGRGEGDPQHKAITRPRLQQSTPFYTPTGTDMHPHPPPIPLRYSKKKERAEIFLRHIRRYFLLPSSLYPVHQSIFPVDLA